MRQLSPLALALCLGMPVAAQELRPLREVLPSAAVSYPSTRCAGLYQALAEWAGFERMGEETFARAEQAVSDLFTVAVIALQRAGMDGTIEHISEIVLRDIRNVADLYLTRFEANYAAQGEGWGSDQLVDDDLTLCQGVAIVARQIVSGG